MSHTARRPCLRVRELGRAFLAAVFAESQPVPRSATASLPSTCGVFSGTATASQGKAAVTKAQVRSLVLAAPSLPFPFYRVEILIPALKGC